MMRGRRILAYRRLAAALMPDPLHQMEPGLRLLIVAGATNRADILAEREATRIMLRGRQKDAKVRRWVHDRFLVHEDRVATEKLELFHDLKTGDYVQITEESDESRQAEAG